MIRILFKIRFAFLHPLKSIKKITKKFRSHDISDKDLFLKTGIKINIIVEAGASDGVDTLELNSYFPEARIFALEPVKDQFEHLTIKFKNTDNVFLINKASSITLTPSS